MCEKENKMVCVEVEQRNVHRVTRKGTMCAEEGNGSTYTKHTVLTGK